MNPEVHRVYILASCWDRSGSGPSLLRAPTRKSLNRDGAAKKKNKNKQTSKKIIRHFGCTVLLAWPVMENSQEGEVDCYMTSAVSFWTFLRNVLKTKRRNRNLRVCQNWLPPTAGGLWDVHVTEWSIDKKCEQEKKIQHLHLYVWQAAHGPKEVRQEHGSHVFLSNQAVEVWARSVVARAEVRHVDVCGSDFGCGEHWSSAGHGFVHWDPHTCDRQTGRQYCCVHLFILMHIPCFCCFTE